MPTHAASEKYVVVARRYRPQRFDELLGQEHVSRALCGAIAANRVGHAYLFTGARGVGKTSAARILAKALNCEQGPAAEPCNECETCLGVSSGEDVDVLEIDGASNRGIDEIRQLRQNVNVRPSRSRNKIYIIDEVHMLTKEAFNALLKTLEEPPGHVKFIFCTTEPEKLPITVISRCQRFDFAGIQVAAITGRLRQIVEAEGIQAEEEALEILARRAGGSMRDSQSLLEQLLAFGEDRITADDVHQMLGTAASGRMTALIEHLVGRDAAAALEVFDSAVAEGADEGQLIDQLLGYLRDAMVSAVGCTPDMFLHTLPAEREDVQQAAAALGVQTILAMMQILDQSLARMRVSTQRRALAELALVRICKLADVEQISALIGQVSAGVAPAQATSSQAPSTPSAGAKKNDEAGVAKPPPAPPPKETSPPPPSAGGIQVTGENCRRLWLQAVAELGQMTAELAGQCSGVDFVPPNRLAVRFAPKYSFNKSYCEKPGQQQRIEQALSRIAGNAMKIEFSEDEQAAAEEVEEQPRRPIPQHERLREATANPLVRRAVELFGAEPLRVDDA